MNRRIFGLALSSTVLLPFETRAATATLTFLSLTPSPPPATRGDIYGYPKGTIGFKFYRGATSKSPISATLTSYGNNGGDGRYQCVNLITAFAKALQLPSFVTGNGNQCASNLAANSGGAFQYVLNGAAALPKLGAVISTDTWLGQQLNAAGTAYTSLRSGCWRQNGTRSCAGSRWHRSGHFDIGPRDAVRPEHASAGSVAHYSVYQGQR
jgi:hypothetical protein